MSNEKCEIAKKFGIHFISLKNKKDLLKNLSQKILLPPSENCFVFQCMIMLKMHFKILYVCKSKTFID